MKFRQLHGRRHDLLSRPVRGARIEIIALWISVEAVSVAPRKGRED